MDSTHRTTIYTWTGALILAVALDLGRNHAAAVAKPRSRGHRETPHGTA
jgi:hypothetical protein